MLKLKEFNSNYSLRQAEQRKIKEMRDQIKIK